MVNSTVNPLQTVIKIAIILPHPPGCSSALQGSLMPALQGKQQGQAILCVQEVANVLKRLGSGHPLLV